jgi:tetraacyldisaccharide 4'-kinase
MRSCTGCSSMPDAAALRHWVERRWYRAGPGVLLVLLPFSAVFAVLVQLRRWAYRSGLFASTHPGVPVVVVGNLTVGGTGKTPLVIWLAERLAEAGIRAGVVLRGYGGSARGVQLVSGASDPAQVGDEAVLIAMRTGCTVAVGVDRRAAAALLVDAGCKLILSDDGLQHLALRRDLEIVVIDGARGLGNGALLPAGPLREPARRLRQVDAVVINGAESAALSGTTPCAAGTALRMTLQPGALRCLFNDHVAALASLRGEVVHAVAGTGNPGRFFGLLRELGALPIEHAFPDHHRFQAEELHFDDARRIVMTEKDAVKCMGFATDRMWCLPVAAQLPPAHVARLLRLLLAAGTKGGS